MDYTNQLGGNAGKVIVCTDVCPKWCAVTNKILIAVGEPLKLDHSEDFECGCQDSIPDECGILADWHFRPCQSLWFDIAIMDKNEMILSSFDEMVLCSFNGVVMNDKP